VTEFNEKLARETLAFIKANPAEWDQTSFLPRPRPDGPCCFAGLVARNEMSWESWLSMWEDSDLDVPFIAAELLGVEFSINGETPLFKAANSIEDLEHIINGLAAEADTKTTETLL